MSTKSTTNSAPWMQTVFPKASIGSGIFSLITSLVLAILLHNNILAATDFFTMQKVLTVGVVAGTLFIFVGLLVQKFCPPKIDVGFPRTDMRVNVPSHTSDKTLPESGQDLQPNPLVNQTGGSGMGGTGSRD